MLSPCLKRRRNVPKADVQLLLLRRLEKVSCSFCSNSRRAPCHPRSGRQGHRVKRRHARSSTSAVMDNRGLNAHLPPASQPQPGLSCVMLGKGQWGNYRHHVMTISSLAARAVVGGLERKCGYSWDQADTSSCNFASRLLVLNNSAAVVGHGLALAEPPSDQCLYKVMPEHLFASSV